MNLLVMVSSLAAFVAQSPQVNYFPPALHEQLQCSPLMLPEPPVAGIRVVGNYEPNRTMFGTGDGIIIDAGSAQGIKAGQQFFVRRLVHDEFIGIPRKSTELGPASVHTAGWITVVEVRDNLSVATVTHACDGVIAGDYLDPFTDPVDPPAAVEGAPDFDHAGRIVMGDERRQTGSAGTLMVLDRGTAADVRPGQTVTIFRETLNGAGPVYQVGRGTIVSVRPESSLVRIDATREAVYIGDEVAINRITK